MSKIDHPFRTSPRGLRIAAVTVALLVTGILTSCNESGTGIFYSIRNEVAYDDSTLENDLTIGAFIEIGSNYYAAGGGLYVRDSAAGSTNWTAIALPSSADVSVVTSAAFIGTDIFATITAVDGFTSELYRYDTSTEAWSTSALDVDSGVTDEYVSSVVQTDSGSLVANVRTASNRPQYASHLSSDGTTFTVVTLPVDTAAVEAFVTFGGDNWILAGGRLYTDGSGSYALVSDANAPGGDEQPLSSVVQSSLLGALIVASSDGTLYAYDGTSWFTAIELFDEESREERITALAVLTLPSGAYSLLIGTDFGYREILYSTAFDTATFAGSAVATPGDGDDSSSGSDYAIVDLRESVVLNFTTSGSLLFVGTGGAGLWRTEYGVDGQNWDRE